MAVHQEWVGLDRLWLQCCQQDERAAQEVAEGQVRSYPYQQLSLGFLTLFIVLAGGDLLYWVVAGVVNAAAWHTGRRLWEVPHAFLLLLLLLLGAGASYLFHLSVPRLQEQRMKEVLLRKHSLLAMTGEELLATDWADDQRRKSYSYLTSALAGPVLPPAKDLPLVPPPALSPGASYPEGGSRRWFAERLQQRPPSPGWDEEAEVIRDELLHLEERMTSPHNSE